MGDSPFVLVTSRLRLRPVAAADLSELLRLFREPAVRRYLLDDALVSERWVRNEIAASRERFEAGSGGLWCVHLGDARPLIGFAGFREFFQPPELQLLYGLHPLWWGKGLATEAATAVARFGFESLGLSEIRAAADLPNDASRRVLERLGMRRTRVTEEAAGATVHYVLRPTAEVPWKR